MKNGGLNPDPVSIFVPGAASLMIAFPVDQAPVLGELKAAKPGAEGDGGDEGTGAAGSVRANLSFYREPSCEPDSLVIIPHQQGSAGIAEFFAEDFDRSGKHIPVDMYFQVPGDTVYMKARAPEGCPVFKFSIEATAHFPTADEAGSSSSSSAQKRGGLKRQSSWSSDGIPRSHHQDSILNMLLRDDDGGKTPRRHQLLELLKLHETCVYSGLVLATLLDGDARPGKTVTMDYKRSLAAARSPINDELCTGLLNKPDAALQTAVLKALLGYIPVNAWNSHSNTSMAIDVNTRDLVESQDLALKLLELAWPEWLRQGPSGGGYRYPKPPPPVPYAVLEVKILARLLLAVLVLSNCERAGSERVETAVEVRELTK